jgi:hypothetical protein
MTYVMPLVSPSQACYRWQQIFDLNHDIVISTSALQRNLADAGLSRKLLRKLAAERKDTIPEGQFSFTAGRISLHLAVILRNLVQMRRCWLPIETRDFWR